MKPDISIVVPCYQVEKYLEHCVDSILNQTHKNFEVILVDDGSTDNTAQICDHFAQAHSNIVVIHKKNGGLSDARNVGMEHASGEYICFIDSDDYIHPDYLKVQYELAKTEASDIVVCAYQEVYAYSPSFHNVLNPRVITYNGKEAVRQLILSNKLMNYAWNKFYKRSLFEQVKYPVGKRWEDIGVTYKLFAMSEKVVYVEAPLYFYLQREGSITASKKLVNTLDQYDLLLARYKDLENEYPDLVDALRTQLCVCCYWCWSSLQVIPDDEPLENLEKAEECITFLNIYGRMQLKSWAGNIKEKKRIQLYFTCRCLLKQIIKIKRRLEKHC